MFQKIALALATTLVVATPAFAGKAPWERPPQSVTPAQAQTIQEITKFAQQQKNPAAALGRDPLDVEWGRRRNHEPMANVTKTGLRALLSGNYAINIGHDINNYKRKFIIVRYFAPDGDHYQCVITPTHTLFETKRSWTIRPAFTGLAGVLYADDLNANKNFAFSFLFNNDTGIATLYFKDRRAGKHVAYPGWVQKQAPGFVPESCLQMPYKTLNKAQTALTWDALIKQPTKRIKNIRGVGFRNDYKDPVTSGMYYSHVPPIQ